MQAEGIVVTVEVAVSTVVVLTVSISVAGSVSVMVVVVAVVLKRAMSTKSRSEEDELMADLVTSGSVVVVVVETVAVNGTVVHVVVETVSVLLVTIELHALEITLAGYGSQMGIGRLFIKVRLPMAGVGVGAVVMVYAYTAEPVTVAILNIIGMRMRHVRDRNLTKLTWMYCRFRWKWLQRIII